MFWLSLLGLAITVGGGIISAVGQAQKNAADEAKLQGQIPVYNAEQAAIQANLANLTAEEKRAKETAAINEQQIKAQATYQETNVAQAGARAVGANVAGAAKDNLAGMSVLRRSQYIQDQTNRQLGMISSTASAEVQKQELGLQGTLGSIGVSRLGAQASLLQSQTNEANAQADISFLQKYGWMSVTAVALGAGAQVINQVADIKWPQNSLATEGWSPQANTDYSIDLSSPSNVWG